MDNLKNPLNVLRLFLKNHPLPHYAVGLSGGMDSLALTHALFLLKKEFSFTVTALHAQHGLSPHAEKWLAFSKKMALERGFFFESAHLNLKNAAENTARSARFCFFKEASASVPVFLAQHLNDQAETVLFKTFRGGGLKAFSGMKTVQKINGLTLFRPWLGVSREVIFQFAQKEKLSWVEDESNQNEIYSRNFLRHQILRPLKTRFPNVEQQLFKNAQHAQEALFLLNDLAEMDFARAALSSKLLSWAVLKTMPFLRLKNLIRFLVEENGENVPSFLQLEEFCRQLKESQKSPEWHFKHFYFHAQNGELKIIQK